MNVSPTRVNTSVGQSRMKDVPGPPSPSVQATVNGSKKANFRRIMALKKTKPAGNSRV
jgi:hypothetical protein